MNRMKTPAYFAILILFGFACGCGGGHKANADDAADAPSAAVIKVTRGDLADNLEIASEFQPFQEIDVYAKVSGYIQKLNVDLGTHVQAGASPGGAGNSRVAAATAAGRGIGAAQRAGSGARARRTQPRAIGLQRRARDLHRAWPTCRNPARNWSRSRKSTWRKGRIWKPAQASPRRRPRWPPPSRVCRSPKRRSGRTRPFSTTRA